MLAQRIITALVLLVLILPTIFILPSMSWGLLTLLFLAVAGFEWRRLQTGHATTFPAWIVAAILMAVGLAWLFAAPRLAVWEAWEHRVAMALFMLATFYWLAIAPARLRKHDVASGGPLPIIVLLLACWVALFGLRELGTGPLVVALCLVWVADIGAYFVGRGIGKRRLAPNISPGKSWEGAIGGAFFVAVIGLIVAAAPGLESALPARLISQWGPWFGVVVLVGLAAMSVVGDLHESLLKRQAKVKDSGRILPGHGGVLDRIDALLPTMPLVVLLHRLLT